MKLTVKLYQWTLFLLCSVLYLNLSACSPNKQNVKNEQNSQTSEWQLVWQDEFDGEQINTTKWNLELDCAGGGNYEHQCYTQRSENAYLADGKLHIVAKEERFSGPQLAFDKEGYNPKDTSKTRDFTSARLNTHNKFNFKYGRVDIRAKVAAGKGMWSALWMLPQNETYGKWPASGEIDIMEVLNVGYPDAKNEVHGTLHYGMWWPQWENKIGAIELEGSLADGFHEYSVEWDADEIRWYVDGNHYQTQNAEGWYNYIWHGQEKGFDIANPRAPFDHPFYLILNLAVGGSWPGEPDRNWGQNRKMEVDYVRVYQCDPEQVDATDYTGKGCGTMDPNVTLNKDAGRPNTNEYQLFNDKALKLSLMADDSKAENQLVIGGTNVISQLIADDQRGQVLQFHFDKLGKGYLQSQDMSQVKGLESALWIEGQSGWTIHGEVKFDLKVIEASKDSQISVKLVSNEQQQGGSLITLPSTNEWTPVSVKISDIISNPIPEKGGVDLSSVLQPFVLEYQGSGAIVQVDNIRLKCAFNPEPEEWQIHKTCSLQQQITPPQPIHVDVNNQGWLVWNCCDGARFTEVVEQDKTVIEYHFGKKPDAVGLQSLKPVDITQYNNGYLEFDLKQVKAPTSGAPWYVKIEGKITAGQVLLTAGGEAPTTEWQTYKIPLSGRMAEADFTDIRKILIFPEWGKGDGAVMRLKNIKFVKAD